MQGITVDQCAQEERAVLENIHNLDRAIAEMAGLVTLLEGRLDVARQHLPHPTIAEEKPPEGSELSRMLASKTSAIGDFGYRMKNLLDELVEGGRGRVQHGQHL